MRQGQRFRRSSRTATCAAALQRPRAAHPRPPRAPAGTYFVQPQPAPPGLAWMSDGGIPLLRFGTSAPSTVSRSARTAISTACSSAPRSVGHARRSHIGTSLFGWRLGVEPMFSHPDSASIALASRAPARGSARRSSRTGWPRRTTRTRAQPQPCARPLVGTLLRSEHRGPNAFLNVLVLVPRRHGSPCSGLPALLKTEQGRGMLMASALIAYLLVAWVTLLGITAVLWSHGIGPQVAT